MCAIGCLLPFASGHGHRPSCSSGFAHLQFLDKEFHEVLKGSFHATDAGAVQGHNELLASESPSSLVLHWVTCHQAPSPGSLLPLIDCIDL